MKAAAVALAMASTERDGDYLRATVIEKSGGLVHSLFAMTMTV